MSRKSTTAGKPQGGVTLLITGLPAAGKTTLGKALAADRAEMRQLATRSGSFVEVYLSTPLAECERRDPKGLYARARSGDLKHMTGIDDPYEPPRKPELELDGSKLSVEQLVEKVTRFLIERRLLRGGTTDGGFRSAPPTLRSDTHVGWAQPTAYHDRPHT